MKKVSLNGLILLVLSVVIGLTAYFSNISSTNKFIILILVFIGLGVFVKNGIEQKNTKK